MFPLLVQPATAGVVAEDTRRVPGIAARRSVSCSYSCAALWSVYLLSFGDKEKVSRWSTFSPRSILDRLARVRVNSPAQISRRSEIAICAVTSDLRNRVAAPLAPP